MKKGIRIFLLIIFLALFFLPTKTEAVFDSFIKYESNPLNKTNIFHHSILYEDSKFKMWYSDMSESHAKIMRSYSDDGYSWDTGTAINLAEINDNHDPMILNFDSKKIMYYVNSNAGSDYTIKRAETNDEINFTNIVQILKPEQPWEYKAVSCPFVYYKDGVFYLFYCGWNDNGWSIGLATSTDGVNFSRCPNNPLVDINGNTIPGGNSFLLERDGKFYLFFHTWYAAGIDVIESESPLSCQMIWKNRRNLIAKDKYYDQNHIFSPSIIEQDNRTLLYYTGLSASNLLTLNLAYEEATTEKYPVVLIPGLFASWNRQAILHNQPVNYADWQLNPVVKEYTGLVNTFQNLGYLPNQDFYLFPYDWRKKLDDSASDLDDFINQKFPDPETKINLVGHSLGGLLGRIYAQKYGGGKINKLVTVGSPHLGAAQTYKPVEAGEIDRQNDLIWLAEKLVLILNKNGFETDKETINQIFPVALDLFPTYNFLKDQNNQEIDYRNMSIKNDTFIHYNPDFPNLFGLLQTIAGEKGETSFGYKIGQRTIMDQLLDLYIDGRPTEDFFDLGDTTVLSSSAKAGNNPLVLPEDHGGIIYKKEAIKKILDSLTLSYNDDQIVEGAGTKISPSLLFLIKSPAKMEVEFGDQTYYENEGLVYIENAQSGDYTLKVKGQELGNYTVIIGQLAQNKDLWIPLSGKIYKNPPDSQTDTYVITFDQDNPQEFPVNQNNINSLFKSLITELTIINETAKNKNLYDASVHLKEARINYQKEDWIKLRFNLEETHKKIFIARKKINSQINRHLLNTIAKLENLYQQSLKDSNLRINPLIIRARLVVVETAIPQVEVVLLLRKKTGGDVAEDTEKLIRVKEKVDKAKDNYRQQIYFYADILSQSAEKLFREIVML